MISILVQSAYLGQIDILLPLEIGIFLESSNLALLIAIIGADASDNKFRLQFVKSDDLAF